MANYDTLEDTVQTVIKTIGLVSGTGVQIYKEDLIEVAVQQSFDLIFRKKNWPHLTEWLTGTLDGTVGILDSNINGTVQEWQHIREIYVADTDQRVVMPVQREHLHVSGSVPLYYTPLPFGDKNFATRILQFWPIAATGDVDMLVKKKPTDFDDNDEIPIPKDIMAYAASWQVLANDGINPDAADRAKIMFEASYSDWISEQVFAEGHGSSGRRRRNVFVMGNTL